MTEAPRDPEDEEDGPGSRRSFLAGIAATGLGASGMSGRRDASGSSQREEPLLAVSEHDDPIGPTEYIEFGRTIAGELTEDDSHGFHEASGVDFDEFYPVPHDAYEFDATAGRHLTFSLETPRDFWSPLLILLDTDGEVVTLPSYRTHLDHPTTFRYLVPETGRYTVLVTSRLAEEYFEYELSIRCQSARELFGEKEPISCGDAVRGELTPDDAAGFDLRNPAAVHDAYELDLTEGRVLRAGLVGDPDHEWERDGATNHATLDLVDDDGRRVFTHFVKDGRLISRSSSSRGESYLWGRVPADGRYTLLVSSVREAYFSYELGVTCDPDEAIEPRRIECGETVCGNVRVEPDRFPLDPPPTDRYEFEGRRGQEMTVRVRFPDGVRSYDLRGPRNTGVRQGSSPESPIEIVVPSALEGTYTLDVWVPTSIAPESNPYDLTLECEPGEIPEPDEHRPVDCGQSVAGELTEDDPTGFRGPEYHHDDYSFDGQRGQTVSLRMESESGNGMLYLLDPDEEVVAQTDGTGRVRDGAIDDVTLERTGTYRIVATSRTNDATFEYALTMFCTGSSD